METWQQRLRRETRETAEAIDRALALSSASDEQLRSALEEAAKKSMFSSLIALWGPAVYRRYRVLFRPFILAHFPWATLDRDAKPLNPWKGPSAVEFQRWLEDVDSRGDIELFRKLYTLKLGAQPWKEAEPTWRRDLLARFRQASTRPERAAVLACFDLFHSLDEPTAKEMYTIDPEVARAFILKHLPSEWSYYGKDTHPFWEPLIALAKARGDEQLALGLYRRQVPARRWRDDALARAEQLRDPAELVAALQKHHPEHWVDNVPEVFLELAQRRGRDVLPYLLGQIHHVHRRFGFWRNKGYDGLIDLAREHQWLDLWSALLRTAATPQAYSKEVRELVLDKRLPADEVRRRLLLLAGVGREYNFPGLGLAQVKQLEDDTAVALYERFPELIRGPFRSHVASGWQGVYPKLTERALAASDEDLIDYLASRIVMYDLTFHFARSFGPVVDLLSAHYEALLDRPAELARRAASALGRVPAFAVWNYANLVRSNRLARLFFERTHGIYLSDPRAVRDLLESPQIHVQALAFRVLGEDDPRARAQASANLDLLQATLLRPLHRKTRMMAFGALRNAAAQEEHARAVLARCREALDLPDKRYPKEKLIGLIGEILHRHPALRGAREQPVVFREGA